MIFEWQPIASAPTDGTPILVAVAGGEYHAAKAWWSENAKQWLVSDSPCLILTISPTHWMPLPEPPIVEMAA
jgi:hypothetical protein